MTETRDERVDVGAVAFEEVASSGAAAQDSGHLNWSGTARVGSVATTSNGCLITLEASTRSRFDVRLGVPPDQRSAAVTLAGKARPLAVLVVCGESSYSCSVLVTGARGPERQDVSFAHALALCEAGVHGVFRRDPNPGAD